LEVVKLCFFLYFIFVAYFKFLHKVLQKLWGRTISYQMLRTLEGFFHPKTVAIVGASTVENSTGWAMANQAKKTFFNEGLFFVNPRGGELFGLPLYKSIADVPVDQIDLAILAIRADFTAHSVEELATKKKCFYQVIVSGGFSEASEEGKKIQNELVSLCEKYGIRIIGPNCVGIYSPSENIDCLFVEGVNAQRPIPGNLSLASQSGGYGMCMVLQWSYIALDYYLFPVFSLMSSARLVPQCRGLDV
jgi:acyl-CoA synthetase (NDP forming)